MTAWLCPLCNEENHAAGEHCVGCGLERVPKLVASAFFEKPRGPLWDRHKAVAGKAVSLIFLE